MKSVMLPVLSFLRRPTAKTLTSFATPMTYENVTKVSDFSVGHSSSTNLLNSDELIDHRSNNEEAVFSEAEYHLSSKIHVESDRREKCQEQELDFHLGLYSIEILLSCFIVFPLNILFWSSTWYMLDLFLFSTFPVVSIAASLCVGLLIQVSVFYILPSGLIRYLSNRSLSVETLQSLVQYIHAVAVIMSWRGVWNCTLFILGNDLFTYMFTLIVVLVIVLLLRSCGTLASSPFIVELDKNNFQQTQPHFRTNVSDGVYYGLDVIVSVCVIQSLVIVFWVILWSLLDSYVYIHQPIKSYLTCLLIGYISAFYLFYIQDSVYQLSIGMGNSVTISGRMVEIFYKVLAAVTTILMWRGLWGIVNDVFLSPGGLEGLAAIFLHISAFIGMLVLGVSRTLGWVNYDVDTELGTGSGCIWRISILNTINNSVTLIPRTANIE